MRRWRGWAVGLLLASCDPVVYENWTERPGDDRDQGGDQDQRVAVYDIIVDNDSARYTEVGEWFDSNSPGHYGEGSRWSATSVNDHRATFGPVIDEAGAYVVSAWWVTGSNRAPNAEYRIEHQGGTTSVRVDQTVAGSRWNVLGTFALGSGDAGKVVLTNAAEAGLVVSADAVRCQHDSLVQVEGVVDNSDPDFSAADGTWLTSTDAAGFWGDDYRRRAVEAISDVATWRADLAVDGTYEVFARWPAAAGQSNAAPYLVLHTDGPTTVHVDQQQNGGAWVTLGTYELQAGAAARVSLSCWATSGDYVVADAVRLVLRAQ